MVMLRTTAGASGSLVWRYKGTKTLTSCPAAAMMRGRVPATSASPPVFENGTHSDATKAIRMDPAPHPAAPAQAMIRDPADHCRASSIVGQVVSVNAAKKEGQCAKDQRRSLQPW